MTYSQFDPAMKGRTALNAGKTVGTERPLTQKRIVTCQSRQPPSACPGISLSSCHDFLPAKRI